VFTGNSEIDGVSVCFADFVLRIAHRPTVPLYDLA
jgi:hypothetical protein